MDVCVLRRTYELLQRFNDRYSKDDAAEFDYIITENGISDATDVRKYMHSLM